jgi:hypothetical protein
MSKNFNKKNERNTHASEGGDFKTSFPQQDELTANGTGLLF